MGDESLNIVVFPWLAFGHMIPFLELSKSLASKGHRITFISTRRNIQRLPKIPPQLAQSQLIHFVPLPLPACESLPENAEATSDVSPDQVQYLKKAFDGLEGPFAKFIEEVSPKPDWIILDFAQFWAPEIASASGIPSAYFSVFIAAFLAFFGQPEELLSGKMTEEQLMAPPKWVSFPSNVAFRRHEAEALIEASIRVNASGSSDAYRMGTTLKLCKAVAMRSCVEFESDWLKLLQKLYKKPVVPIGLVSPPIEEKDPKDGSLTGEMGDIFKWLDQQAPRSVVYVAFGSEARLSIELSHELALGLELSKLPFLWAFRKPVGVDDDDTEILPEGFEDRTKGRGIVTMNWLPQLKILAHPSVGGFLTHCGWSSVIEGLQFGHALVFIPIFGDQGLNARVMEDKKIGLELQRKEEDGAFSRDIVAKALRLVMVEEEGQPFRLKVKVLKEVFRGWSSDEHYIDEFIQFLEDYKHHEG